MHNCNNASCCNNQNKQYKEFVPYEEYSIGDFFKIKNEIFKVVEFKNNSERCLECDLDTFEYHYYCDTGKCSNSERWARDIVEFILYDTLEENE